MSVSAIHTTSPVVSSPVPAVKSTPANETAVAAKPIEKSSASVPHSGRGSHVNKLV